MSELKPCHNDLPDRLRWWAAHCDMTSCGCRISSLMMQAADTLERCDQPDHIGDTNKMIADNAPRPLDGWGEDYGDCLWWAFPIEEPPYCGTPLDCDWPGYHTHFTRFTCPEEPALKGETKNESE